MAKEEKIDINDIPTKDLDEVGGGSGNGEKGSDGKKQKMPPFVSAGQFGGMITQKELPNALDKLVTPGETAKDMAMRTVIVPQKRTEGTRLASIYAYHYGRLRYFGDQEGEDQFLFLLAISTSVGGISRNQLTDAIIGERHHEQYRQDKGGFLKAAERIAWGDGRK